MQSISESKESSEHTQSNSIFIGLRVLLADADEFNKVVTQKLLKKPGWNVATVASGFESLSALGQAASSFQILILDIQMPELEASESLEVKFVYWSSSRSLHIQHLQLKWFAIRFGIDI